jgi:coenzyme F420-0:L-glutamate ligase/coenzyme F420-1:gamma-L-glutamate ligase
VTLIIEPLRGLPLVAPGDELATLLATALTPLLPSQGDIVVVAQKIVSKAEGRLVRLADVTPSPRAEALAAETGKPAALCELILAETAEIMRIRKDLIVTRHRLGPVCANAGIDASNVGGGDAVLLWPEDPDASAGRLRASLAARLGITLPVIISDSLGRAWRWGTMGHAIGVAGMKPLRDRRGETDLFGRVLVATLTGLADEIAAAATLAMGEGAEGTPAALVRGVVWEPDEASGTAPLLRPAHEDLFP